jgi:hypothetical protein
MTKAEYDRLYRLAGRELPNLTLSQLKKLKSVYIKAGKNVGKIIRDAKKRGLSDLTQQSWASIDQQLTISIENIRKAIDSRTMAAVRIGQNRFSKINTDYLDDIIDNAGELVTRNGIKTIYRVLNTRVVESVVNRIWQDGYTYSERIWRAGLRFQNDVKNVISAGLAQGRDVVKIAKDLQRYIRGGKKELIRANAYGELKRGTKQFINRIGNQVDYRALRIIRSELYASMQDSAKWSGQYNPACNGLYDWVRSGTKDWGCNCPANAEGSPYTYENVPGYDHPNCLCRIVPRLRDHNEIVSDLKAWARGEKVDYLDDWHRDYYLPYAS